MRKLETRAWWPELLQRKDDYSLRELAEMFGVTPGAINNALHRTGVGRNSAPSGPRVRRGRTAAPAKRQKSPRGRNARALTEKRLEPYAGDLGILPDGVIGERAGLSAATVARIRRGRGIPATTRKLEAGKSPSSIARYQHLLGSTPDAEIAALAGVSRAAVRNFRVRRGIPSAPRRVRDQVSETVPDERRSHKGAVWAWEIVERSGGRLVCVADSVYQAMLLAKARGVDVREVRRVGRVLNR